MRFTLLLFLLFAFSGIAYAQELSGSGHEEYIALMDSADVACSEENWVKAEGFLLQALRLEPANPSNIILVSNLGMIRFYDGRDSLALATLDGAVAMAPNSVVALRNRAKVLSSAGKLEEAQADRAKIMALDSTDVNNIYLHAVTAMMLNDSSSVNADLSLMETLVPSDPRTFRLQAQKLVSEGRFLEAISPLNKIIASEPASEIYSMRAMCNLMLDRLNEASEDIAEGLALDPLDGELYLYRALLNRFRYRDDESADDARRAVQLGIPIERAAPLLPKK